MLVCLAKDSFIRSFGDIGYIINQLTKQDKIYDINGKIFLQEIIRKPKTIDEIIDNLMKIYTGADREELAGDFALMRLYVTGGNDVSESTLASNAAQINNILSNAGLSFYLNSTSKAGDIRAAVGEIQNIRHIRFGVQFPDSNEVEFIRDIANPDDLNQIKTLISTVSEQAQLLAQLLTNSGLLSNVTDNSIIKLIFEDLFGSN